MPPPAAVPPTIITNTAPPSFAPRTHNHHTPDIPRCLSVIMSVYLYLYHGISHSHPLTCSPTHSCHERAQAKSGCTLALRPGVLLCCVPFACVSNFPANFSRAITCSLAIVCSFFLDRCFSRDARRLQGSFVPNFLLDSITFTRRTVLHVSSFQLPTLSRLETCDCNHTLVLWLCVLANGRHFEPAE